MKSSAPSSFRAAAALALTVASCATTPAASPASSAEARPASARVPAPPRLAPAIEQWPAPLSKPKDAADARARRAAFDARPPDARFLRAIEEIASLNGTTPSTVEPRAHDGRWVLVRSESMLAVVDEWPGFASLFEAVQATAPKPEAAPRTPPAGAPLLVGLPLVTELEAIHAEWTAGKRTPELLGRAAHAFASLAFETNDTVGLADVVAVRAIAFAAMARAAGTLAPADAALLAEALGYSREALAMAESLAADEPIRLYLSHSDAALEARATAPGATPGTRYLWTRRAATSSDSERMAALAAANPEEHATPPFLHAHLRSGTFDGLARFAPMTLAAELDGLFTRVRLTPEELARRRPADSGRPSVFELVETALVGIGERGAGPFDAELERTLVRARVASAVDAMYRHQLARRSDARLGDTMAGITGGEPNGPLRDVGAWFAARAYRLRDGVFDVSLRHLRTGLGGLGGDAVARFADEAIGGMPAQPTTLEIARLVARRLDTRPSHRMSLLDLLARHTIDQPWAERMARRVLAVVDREGPRNWLAQLAGDWSELERAAADATRSPSDRILTLRRLHDAEQLTADETAKRMRAICDASPDDLAASDSYVTLLDDLNRNAELASFVEAWLERRPDEHTLRSSRLRAMLARALWTIGRAREAWKHLGPAIEFGPQDALYEAGLVQLALGNRQRALQFEEQLMASYPRTGFTSSVGILWRAGAYDLAGKRLLENGGSVRWRYPVAGVFVASFEAKPREAAAAIRAIPPQVNEGQLLDFMNGLVDRKRFDFAALVADRLGATRSLDGPIEGYRVVRTARDAAAADAWLRSRYPGLGVAAIEHAFERGHHDLVFDLPRTIPAAKNDPLVAFLQSVVLARRRVGSGPEADALRERASSMQGTPAWLPVRVVLGLDPLERLPIHGARVHEAFVRATLAEARGDYREAIECYFDVLDLRTFRDMDHGWAQARLAELTKSGKSIERLAREGP